MAAKPLIWGHIFAPKNILYFFQVTLFNFKTQYEKHIFKIYLEKQKKKVVLFFQISHLNSPSYV